MSAAPKAASGWTRSAWAIRRRTRWTRSAGLLLIGPDAAVDSATLNAYLEEGGKAFFLPRSQAQGWPWNEL